MLNGYPPEYAIVPYGIETSAFNAFVAANSKLLIVPYGIETDAVILKVLFV